MRLDGTAAPSGEPAHEAVILLHGFCSNAHTWDRVAASLQEAFTVLAPDWPGFGARRTEPPLRSIEAMARHVLDLADRYRLRRFHVVGHSMSGFVVQHLLIHHPERVGRAVLYGTFCSLAEGGRFESVEDTADRLRRDGIDRTVQRIVATWFRAGARDPDFAEAVRQGSQMALEAAVAAMVACRGFDVASQLGGVGSPVLVVVGERDQTVRLDAAVDLARRIPGAGLAVLPHAAHAAHLERAELFDLLLAQFLTVQTAKRATATSFHEMPTPGPSGH